MGREGKRERKTGMIRMREGGKGGTRIVDAKAMMDVRGIFHITNS